MNPRYLKYYERFSSRNVLKYFWDSLFARSKNSRLSLLNRQRDYQALATQPERFSLHRNLNQILAKSAHWESHDYGEGYFYQGFRSIGVSGLRDTEARVEKMNLKELVQGKSVLEIGCNTGFLTLCMAPNAKKIVGMDVNPYLIQIAKQVAQYLKVENVDFQVSSFEAFHTNETFEVVLSFANHATYDKNTKQGLTEYFQKCRSFLCPEGLFLFESHPKDLEEQHEENTFQNLQEQFKVLNREELIYGTPLDLSRFFVTARVSPAASC